MPNYIDLYRNNYTVPNDPTKTLSFDPTSFIAGGNPDGNLAEDIFLGGLNTLIAGINAVMGWDLPSATTVFNDAQNFLQGFDLAADADSFLEQLITGGLLHDLKTDFDGGVSSVLGVTFPITFPFTFGISTNDTIGNFVSISQWQQLLDGMVNDGVGGHTPNEAISAFRIELTKARSDVAQAIQDGLHFQNQDTGIAQGLQSIGLPNLVSALGNDNFATDIEGWFETSGDLIGRLKYGVMPNISVGGIETDIQDAAQQMLDSAAGKVDALLTDAEDRLQYIAKEGDDLAVGVWNDASKVATVIGGEATNIEDATKGIVDNINAAVGVEADQTIDTLLQTFSAFPGSNLLHDVGLTGDELHQQVRDVLCNAFGLDGSGHGLADMQTAAAALNRQVSELVNGKKFTLSIFAVYTGIEDSYDWETIAPYLIAGDKIDYLALGGGSGGVGGSILLHGVGGNAGQWSTTTGETLVVGMDINFGDTLTHYIGDGGFGGSIPGGSSGAGENSTINLNGTPIGTGVGGTSVSGTSGAIDAWWGDGVSPVTNIINGQSYTGGTAQQAAGHSGHSSGGAGAGGDIGYSESNGGKGATGLVVYLAHQA